MDGISVNPDICVFCMDKVDGARNTWSKLSKKGVKGIIEASSQRYKNPKDIALSQKSQRYSIKSKNASVQQEEEAHP